ncbi:MAG: S8 family serine peptidase, partial [Caulobacteraceae bacterium]
HLRFQGDVGGGYDDAAGRSALRGIADRLARGRGLVVVGDWPMPLLGLDCFILRAPPGRSADAEASALSRQPGVAFSEPVRLFRTQGAGARLGKSLFAAQPATRAWRLADLHQIADGRGVRVAVIDSRVDQTHPDLLGQVALARDFAGGGQAVAETHGTAVAGIIAARAGNGVGILGVAPGARLLALRACIQSVAGAGAVCDSLALAEALHFAVDHGAGVINLSLAGPNDPLLARLLDVALARGATVVAAVDRQLPGGGFPASHPGVIAVAAEAMEPVAGAVYLAPGRDVPTTLPGGRWSFVNGDSFAAAHVSGLFALLRERSTRARTAAALAPAGGGRIDACASLLRAGGPCDCACARPAAPS